MVARDPLNKTASFVNPLKLVTNDEKEVFQRGIENKKRWVPPFFSKKYLLLDTVQQYTL